MLSVVDGKVCRKCGNWRPQSDWYPDKAPCKLCINAYRARYRQKNLEKLQAQGREAWKRAQPTDPTEKAARNREKRRKQQASSQTRQSRVAQSKRWRERNRDKAREHKRRSRARIRGAGGTYTEAEWQALVEQYDSRCLCCGAVGDLTRDHVVPLVKGGSNDIGNIQPLCRPCNSRKGTKTVDYRPTLAKSPGESIDPFPTLP